MFMGKYKDFQDMKIKVLNFKYYFKKMYKKFKKISFIYKKDFKLKRNFKKKNFLVNFSLDNILTTEELEIFMKDKGV